MHHFVATSIVLASLCLTFVRGATVSQYSPSLQQNQLVQQPYFIYQQSNFMNHPYNSLLNSYRQTASPATHGLQLSYIHPPTPPGVPRYSSYNAHNSLLQTYFSYPSTGVTLQGVQRGQFVPYNYAHVGVADEQYYSRSGNAVNGVVASAGQHPYDPTGHGDPAFSFYVR